MRLILTLAVFLLFGFCAWRAVVAWKRGKRVMAAAWLIGAIAEWVIVGAFVIGHGLTWGGKG